jgi:CRISPR-associated protein Cas1
MLSLSYTMIFNEISSLLDGLGFDPYLGYFHSIDYGRASLAADIMEEFRAPIADRLILNLVNNRVFKPEDFYVNPKNGGVNFKQDALKRYFREYEIMLNNEFIHPETKQNTTLRKCIRIQAEKLALAVQGNNSYIPFMLEI